MIKRLSLEQKSEIRLLKRLGRKEKEIAETYCVALSTIYRLLIKIDKTGSLERKQGFGRKSSLDIKDIQFILGEIKSDPKIGSSKLTAKLLKNNNTSVSSSTIRRCLIKMGYKGRIACRKPLLSKKNIKSRMEWAQTKYNWSDEQWKKVIWSDETKINLFGSDGRQYVRRKDGTRFDLKNLTPTVKHGGGSIMLWGCFSYSGVGELYLIEGKMDRFVYTRILHTALRKSIKDFGIEDFIFQQDNDPKHTSGHVKAYFDKNDIFVMDWPSQSPDMNPIENLWYVLKCNVAKRNPKNKTELVEFCKEEWGKIDPEFIKKLVLSMNKRCREVLDAKGRHTSY